MFKQITEFLLNTPERYWLIINGYHIHKSFWGILFFIAGMLFMIFNVLWIGILIFFIGLLIVTISIIGQKYTHGSYKLEIWEKYSRK